MKDKTVAGVLAFCIGGFGIHRFYLGNILLGFFYLMFFWTLIPAIVSVGEAIYFLSMKKEKFDALYNPEHFNSPDYQRPIKVSSSGKFEDLEKLHKLKEMGAISDDEFKAEKQKMLG